MIKLSVLEFSVVLSLLKRHNSTAVLPLHTNCLFNLNCTTVNENKIQFLPLGHVLQKYPSTEGFWGFFVFLLENCGPDLRQHAIVKAANTLSPGNLRRDRKSKSLCHYETM